jgi:hypothetical protein
MSYQRGSLKQENRKEGVTWSLRYRVNSPDGKRVENTLPIGLVRDFPSKGDAWREVDRLGLGNRINSEEYVSGAIKFAALAEFYLKTDYGEHAGRPKSDTSIPIAEHSVRGLPRCPLGQGDCGEDQDHRNPALVEISA